MAQLTFIHSTMDSGKSLEILTKVFSHRQKNKKVLLFTSEKDTRCGVPEQDAVKGYIATRLGDMKEDAYLIERVNCYELAKEIKPAYIYIDEVHFMDKRYVMEIIKIVDELNIRVICYGLLTDFMANFFPSSEALIKYADKVKELDRECNYCDNKAIHNMRLVNGTPVFKGEQMAIEDWGEQPKVTYVPCCRKCFMKVQETVERK